MNGRTLAEKIASEIVATESFVQNNALTEQGRLYLKGKLETLYWVAGDDRLDAMEQADRAFGEVR